MRKRQPVSRSVSLLRFSFITFGTAPFHLLQINIEVSSGGFTHCGFGELVHEEFGVYIPHFSCLEHRQQTQRMG